MRWRHPTLGLLYPDRFVPLVEQTDLIDKLTEWVVQRALRDLGALGPAAAHRHRGGQRLGPQPRAARVRRAGHARAGRESAIGADRLVVEITETALLTDPEGAAAVLRPSSTRSGSKSASTTSAAARPRSATSRRCRSTS